MAICQATVVTLDTLVAFFEALDWLQEAMPDSSKDRISTVEHI